MGNDLASLGVASNVSIADAKSVQQFDPYQQSIPPFCASARRARQNTKVLMLGGRIDHLCGALDARKLRRVAIWLPVCDRDPTVSVCNNAGEFAEESHSLGVGRLLRFIRAQRLRDMAVSLDNLSASIDESRSEFLFLAVSY